MRLRSALTIGRIRGVAVQVHLSLLLILIYIVVVATAQLPFVLEQLGLEREDVGLSPWVWGVVFAIGLFASVLIHELGHVIVAQKLGGRVRAITLWMLGGASEIEHMPEKRYAELKLAFIGPVVSFALAAVLYLISAAGATGGLLLITRWLASVNVILAIFNLLPAFPMDGGRMLRSALSAWFGKLRGTRIAVRVGQALALGFALLGVLSFNLLLLLIAFFIYMAAKAELAVVTGQEGLRGLRAGDIVMRTTTLDESEPVSTAVSRMQAERTPVLPVRTAAGETAIVSLERVRDVTPDHWDDPVGTIAERVSRSVDADEPVDRAFKDLIDAPGQSLPVEEHGRLIGILRLLDVTQAAELQAMRQPAG